MVLVKIWDMTKADELIARALSELGISSQASDAEKYSKVYDIVSELRKINDAETVNVGTTGAITERICSWALNSVNEQIFYRLTGKNTKWLGDYALLGFPLNLIVSVKSFKAKERLLMSGTGSQLVPTIGYGLFDDSSEFSYDRLVSYRMRGFLAIYMPKYTFDSLQENSKKFKNWNGTKLVRTVEEFPGDLSGSLKKVELGALKRDFVDPLKY
jgi:hypothetical protein